MAQYTKWLTFKKLDIKAFVVDIKYLLTKDYINLSWAMVVEEYGMNLPSHQRGASVTGIVIMIVLIVVCAKIGLAIIPACWSLPIKIVGFELKKSNDNKESVKEFLGNVNSQWHINGVSQKAEDVRSGGYARCDVREIKIMM